VNTDKDVVTESLVKKAQEGDIESFNRLFTLVSDRVLFFVRLRLGAALREKVESMDILQEAYSEAIKAFPAFHYRGEQSFARWLCRLVENAIRAQAKFHGAQKRRPPGDVLPVSHLLKKVPASETGPETAAQRLETRERLAVSLEALPEDERKALLLRHFEGRSLEEMAGLLARSPSAARRLLGRASVKLGALLNGDATPHGRLTR